MARQARNRRSTKHRGNAAGMIESRGRTGRKPKPGEKRAGGSRTSSGSSRSTQRGRRYDKPPTWKGSVVRAAVAAALVYGVVVLFNKKSSPGTDLLLVPLVIAVYVPLIYTTDRYMYRRAQRKKAGG
jgi:hypothetical protein